jgi:hypothetical protein
VEVGCFVASTQEQKKSPVNRRLQGVGDGVEVVGGWRGRRYGRLGVLQTCKGGVVVVLLPELHENEKSP